MLTRFIDLIADSVCKLLMQALLDRSHSLQNYMHNSSPRCQAAEFQKLRHQHGQLLEFNHVLIEENNHRLVDHAELMSEVVDLVSPRMPSLLASCPLPHHPCHPHTPPVPLAALPLTPYDLDWWRG